MSFSLYEDFSRYANATVMAGQLPLIGPVWGTSGAGLPTISDGFLVSNPGGYLYNTVSSPIAEVGCEVSFVGGTDLTQASMTMAISSDPTFSLTNLLHFNFGPANFALTITYHAGGPTTAYPLNSADWSLPMKNDGTVYRLKMAVRGNSVVIFGPNGEVYGASDPRISALSGGQCFWEPATQSGGLKAQVLRSWVVTRNSANPVDSSATNDDFASIGANFKFGRVVGALNKMGEVGIGLSQTVTSFPQIQFGPTDLNSSLTAAAASGATTVSTTDYFPVGTSITIDPGVNADVRTIGAVSGLGPYLLTVPALTHNHASGVAVVATPPASMRYVITYNQISQALNLPYPVIIGGSFAFIAGGPLGTGLYLDSGFTSIISYSSGAVRLGANNAFATGQNITDNRPAAATVGVGAQFYDTSLQKPIWSDGTNWRDAAGTIV
jgi:hypothetical protein